MCVLELWFSQGICPVVGLLGHMVVLFLFFKEPPYCSPGFPDGTSEEPTCNRGDVREVGSIPALERSPGGEHGNPLQYSCLENPMDRGAYRLLCPWGRKNSDTTEQLHFT